MFSWDVMKYLMVGIAANGSLSKNLFLPSNIIQLEGDFGLPLKYFEKEIVKNEPSHFEDNSFYRSQYFKKYKTKFLQELSE